MKKIVFILSFLSITVHGYSQAITGPTTVLGGETYQYSYSYGGVPTTAQVATMSVTNGSPSPSVVSLTPLFPTATFRVTWSNIDGSGKIISIPTGTGQLATALNVKITKQCKNTHISGNITGTKTYSGCTVTASGATFSNSSKVTVTADKTITISPSTVIPQGANATFKVTGTSASSLNLGDAIADIELISGDEESFDESIYVNEEITLGQNYPNPFRENTTINYYLPYESDNALIRIIDRYGAVVNIIPLTQKGDNEIYLDSSGLVPDIYMYSLVVDDVVIDTKRMIISQ